jgi:hypothetical protein
MSRISTERIITAAAAVNDVRDALQAASDRLPAIRAAAAAGHIDPAAPDEAIRAMKLLNRGRIAAMAEVQAVHRAVHADSVLESPDDDGHQR